MKTHAYLMGHAVDPNENGSSCTTSTIMVEVISHNDVNGNAEHSRTLITPSMDVNRRDHRDSIFSKKTNALDHERFDRDLDTIELMPLDQYDPLLSSAIVTDESTIKNYSQLDLKRFHKEIPLKLNVKSEDRYNILDYYEKYSAKTAKTLIDTLFLPSQKICRQCARSIKNSMVYSDRLIYKRQSLYAREIVCYHHQIDTQQIFFRYNDCTFAQSHVSSPVTQDFMPIVSVSKTNNSGLFYTLDDCRDVFDLNETLTPNILLVNQKKDITLKSNTEIYHRITLNMNSRLSRLNICKPMIFHEPHYYNLNIGMKPNSNYNDNLQYWTNYNDKTKLFSSKRHNELALSAARMHQRRSSLLMLEPLLIMPDFPTPRNTLAKNRITHSEHAKIVRIVIAYTLSFFLLAIVTFYIVYFA